VILVVDDGNRTMIRSSEKEILETNYGVLESDF
jgi:hypothetical protein